MSEAVLRTKHRIRGKDEFGPVVRDVVKGRERARDGFLRIQKPADLHVKTLSLLFGDEVDRLLSFRAEPHCPPSAAQFHEDDVFEDGFGIAFVASGRQSFAKAVVSEKPFGTTAQAGFLEDVGAVDL